MEFREVIDWEEVKRTIEDKEEGWYDGLEEASAYMKHVDFYSKQLHRMRVCGCSNR